MRNADEPGRRSEDLQSQGQRGQPPQAAQAIQADSLALLAAVCATPLALLAVLDGQQLRLQAVHGDVAAANAALPLCHQALQQAGLLVDNNAAVAGLPFFAAQPLHDATGQALGVLAVLDVQPRPLTALQQQALQTLAALLAQQLVPAAQQPDASWRLLFERNPLPMWIFDRHSLRFLAVNEAAQQHYGWSAAEFAAMTLKDIRPADDVPALLDDLTLAQNQLRSGGLWRHRRKDGSVIHVDISAHGIPFGGHDARLVLAHDVSHSVAAAQALRDSEARWQRLFAASAIGIAAAGMDGLFSSANPAFCRLVGRDEAAVLGRPVLAFTHADDVPACRQQIDGLLDGSLDSFSIDKRYQRPDGSPVWARATVTLTVPSAGGRQLVAVVLDIDAKRQGEQRLRRQAALLDASHDAIIVHGLDHRISAWNRGAERLFGWPADEALGQDLVALLQQDAVLAAQARQALQQQGEWAGLVRGLCRDGRALMLDARLTLLPGGDGQDDAVLAIQTDVTSRLALEQQLQQSQRLEAVGQLTGGVAHDFNNLLTVIQGNAELLAELLVDQPDLLPLAQMVGTAAQRGAELTQRLLAFARRQPLRPQAVDAHQLLSGMDALLRRTLAEDIDLELVRAAGLWPLLADPVQLESAVLNLVLNARDAMPQGGKITLETANAWIDQAYAERHADVLPGQYVLLSVSDTGVGMGAQQLARAFEPFYTTKGMGKGTGLGLSMVYGFAKQSRGHVKLYSEPGQGTTARLYLPRADGPASPQPSNPGVDGNLRGSATVLVVEDDDLVRRFATELLAGLGYQVLAAEHGAAGLQILQNRSDIDLLFTDVVMPGGMNGRQLADAALALHPRLKLLFTSGYTENAIVHHGRLDRGVHLLAKPYRAVDLARKLRAVLGDKP